MSREVVVVIDLGGTRVRLGHVVDGMPAEASWVRSTDVLRTSAPVEALAEWVRAYSAQAALTPTSVVIGVPVSLDQDFDRVLSSPNIPALEGVHLATQLAASLHARVLLERDIALLLQGEWVAGAGRNARSLLGVFIGTGVGGAFLQNGVPYRGASGGALEIGHIPIRDEGRRCVCGNLDCLEAYASGHHLQRLHSAHAVPFDALFIADPAMNGFPRAFFESYVREHLRSPRPAERFALAWSELGSRAALYGAQQVLERRGAP